MRRFMYQYFTALLFVLLLISLCSFMLLHYFERHTKQIDSDMINLRQLAEKNGLYEVKNKQLTEALKSISQQGQIIQTIYSRTNRFLHQIQILQNNLPEGTIIHHLVWNNAATTIQGITRHPKQIETLIKTIEKNRWFGPLLLDEIQQDKTENLFLFTINIQANATKND